jgi:hypothetical protein
MNDTARPPISASYRRFLFDMHVPDWDPSFLSKFDPERLAAAVKRAGGASITLFSNTHTGLNNWPSAHGRQHKAHQGRDVYGAMVDAAHKAGLNVNLYYCLLYVDWYWDNHPESRIVDVAGESRKVAVHSAGQARRFSTVCPNDPGYRKFALAQVNELGERYVFEGVNLDMTFWPGVCYCKTCRARFAAEVGGEIPETVDWFDKRWLAFAERRRAWMAEFVREVTDAIHAHRPKAEIAHQSGGYVQDWQFGASDDLARLSAWLSADLYRDKRDLSFSFKLFNAASETAPFELISGWIWPNIHEHSVLRTPAELEETAVLPIANNAAIMFIDQIDPIGTIAEENFDLAAPILKRIEALEPVLGGELVQDVGVYVSFDASFDLRQNRRPVAELGYSTEPANPKSGPSAHRSAAIAAGETLTRRHIPYGVVTRRHLDHLGDWQVIVLCNVALLTDEEIAAFRDYVAAGGRLYASGATSLIAPDGAHDALRLGDVLGVEWLGETSELLTYMSPVRGEHLGSFTDARPLTIHERQARVRVVAPDAVVRATVTLPYTEPTGALYASLLTDPPGRPTDDPAIVENAYGKGRTVYAAAPLEVEPHSSQRDVFAGLVTGLLARPPAFEADAPPSVEVTLFRQSEKSRLVAHLINVQADAPPVPVHGIRLTIRPGKAKVRAVVSEPDGAPLPWRALDGAIVIDAPILNAHAVLRIDLLE